MRWGALALVIAWSPAAHADITVDPCACSPNKPGFHRASALTGDWGGLRADLFHEGVRIQGSYAGEVFASPQADGDELVSAGLFALNLDVELSDLLGPAHLPALHVGGFGIHGHGLSERLMDVYGVSGNVAPPGVRLFEAWADEELGPVSVRAGLLAADQEFVLAEHSTVLLNATFGILAMVSYNLGNPVYPVAVPAVRVEAGNDDITVRAAVYDGDQANEHGIPHGLSGEALAIGEVALLDTLKVGGWHHTNHSNGYYGVVDRQLERYVGAFARVSVAPDEPISLYMDTGIRIGPGPLRRRDFASIGLAFAKSERGPQTAVEATYQYLVKGWLTMQPDLQVLLTRGGTAAVAAVRAVVAF